MSPPLKKILEIYNHITHIFHPKSPKYPIYLRHSEHPFDNNFIENLSAFLNISFEMGYKAYTAEKIQAWLKKAPDLYLVVIDIVYISTRPATPQIVGAFKLLPLGELATKKAAAGTLEVIDIDPSNMEADLASAHGIWIGDLSVISPLQSVNSGVLGRHLLEQIKSILRQYKGVKPIFCRSERHDIQRFLLNLGFRPQCEGEITGKSIWMLSASKTISQHKEISNTRQLIQLAKHGNSSQDTAFDIFISHASEDKESIARPIYNALIARNLKVWFDESELTLGDNLRRKIDQGLSHCRYGVVILSPNSLSKEWPQIEIDSLLARETKTGEKAILPVWHEVDLESILRHTPTLAGRVSVCTSQGINSVVEKIYAATQRHKNLTNQ